jgi:hypothetical protein
MEKVIQDFRRLLSRYSDQYGDNSNACLIVRLTLLIYLIKIEYSQIEIDSLCKRICDQYNFERPNPLENKTKISVINHISVYSIRSEKNELIGRNLINIEEKIINLNCLEDLSFIQSDCWYLYCFTKANELKIFDYPWKTKNLILNRDKPVIEGFPIIHPILVFKDNFSVIGAGEVCFIKNTTQLKGVIINNKSGHFRPNPDSLMYVRNFLSHIFGLNEKNIITLNLY